MEKGVSRSKVYSVLGREQDVLTFGHRDREGRSECDTRRARSSAARVQRRIGIP